MGILGKLRQCAIYRTLCAYYYPPSQFLFLRCLSPQGEHGMCAVAAFFHHSDLMISKPLPHGFQGQENAV